MQLIHHDIIASTSTEAHRLLGEGMQTPFAITAREQNAGRGQRTRTWHSPPGNIYLSIACEIQKEFLSIVPLMTACKLAGWLEDILVIQPFIKWPNDILLQKKKCAGILCEAFWEPNTESTKVVIGIGINVEESPFLKEAHYESASIGPWLRHKQSVEELTSSFLHFWESKQFQKREEILSEFERLHLPKGQIWRDRENPETLYTNEGFSSEGHFIIRNVESGVKQELVSAQHSLLLV